MRAVDIPSEEDLRPSGAVEELVAGPASVQVKNTAQAFHTLWPLSAASPKVAPGFTTGANPDGYRLSSIVVYFTGSTGLATVNNQLTVTLNVDNGALPGDAACTLSGVSRADQRLKYAAPAACPTLEPNTTYFVLIERVDFSSAEPSLGYTTSALLDPMERLVPVH